MWRLENRTSMAPKLKLSFSNIRLRKDKLFGHIPASLVLTEGDEKSRNPALSTKEDEKKGPGIAFQHKHNPMTPYICIIHIDGIVSSVNDQI